MKSRTWDAMVSAPPFMEEAQEAVRGTGGCGEVDAGFTVICIKDSGHQPPHGDGGPEWRLQQRD